MISREVLRAWWFHQQGLDGSIRGATAERVLETSGWARSVGGSGPYLGLFSRAGISRSEADQAVLSCRIHELPAARGCTYVVPASHFALALTVGAGFGEESEVNTSKKYLGVTEWELEELADAVLGALSEGPQDPRELKDQLGGKVRNLGPEGKKRGVTTTLPLVLGRLQARGDIRRIPMNGRLDQQRFKYARWENNPRKAALLSREEALVELARYYFRWTGPATPAQFQWFSGLTTKLTRDTLAELNLEPLELGDPRLMFAEDRERLLSFEVPSDPHYILTSGLDNITHLRREWTGIVPECHQEHVRAVGLSAGFSDLPNHAILDRGELVGLWEYDPAEFEIVHHTFVPASSELLSEIKRTQHYIREELGDVRSFSLDSPESRRPRLDALRVKRNW